MWSYIFHAVIAMVARQLKNTRYRAMDATSYVAAMPQILRNHKLLLGFFYINEKRHYVF